MGRAGRVACIFTPFALSAASLVCLILVGLGNRSKSSLNDFYFFKADLRNFTSAPNFDLIPGTNLDNTVLNAALQAAKQDLKIEDFYTVGLWNYCKGNWTNNEWKYDYCSPAKSEYWFNPVEVWGLNNTGVDNLFPKALKDGLNVYKHVAKWMFITYVVAFIATCLTLVIGISAIFSRWGSFVTTMFAGVASIFLLAASILATALYASLKGSFNDVLKDYGIKGSLGGPIYRATWIGWVFSAAAGFFWLLSVCCCSGRSPYHKDRNNRRMTVEKTPYTYERVGSPYMGQSSNKGGQSVPLQPMAGKESAYEPFRHEQPGA